LFNSDGGHRFSGAVVGRRHDESRALLIGRTPEGAARSQEIKSSGGVFFKHDPLGLLIFCSIQMEGTASAVPLSVDGTTKAAPC
jgi:hypothetical protein